jgi:hypothetical protein
LPASERQAWRALWSEVEALHQQVKPLVWASGAPSLPGLTTWIWSPDLVLIPVQHRSYAEPSAQ